MSKLYRNAGIAIKIETTAGTDSVPTPAANAMLVTDLVVSPIAMTVESRELMRSFLGNSEDIVVARWFEFEFKFEAAGAGTAGGTPGYDAVMRLCGHSKTVAAGVSVTYAPISTGFEAASLYMNLDQVLHRSVWCQASLGWDFSAGKLPRFSVKGKGLFRPVTDTTAWAPVYTAFQKPLGVTKANTTASLHTIAAPIETLTVDTAAQIEYRNLINYEGVMYTDRKPGGNISLELTSVATKDWITTASDATTGPLNLVHGLTAGNIVEVACPNVQLTTPKYGNSQGIVMLQCGLKLLPGAAGNDEYSIIVR